MRIAYVIPSQPKLFETYIVTSFSKYSVLATS